MSGDAIERLYRGCRERLGAMGVTATFFRAEIEAVLAEDPDRTLSRLAGDDLYLVFGCRAGSATAWSRFDRTYRGYLVRLATRYAGSLEAGEDLVTDLYSDLVARSGRPGKLEHYKGIAALGTWLAVIVRRMAFDRGRSAERRESRNARLRDEREAHRAPRDPERELLAAEAGQVASVVFAEAFGRLDARHALVLTLVYRDGQTLREAGRVMGLDFSTVSRRAKVARKALLEAMVAVGAEQYDLAEDAVRSLLSTGAAAASFAAVDAGEEGRA